MWPSRAGLRSIQPSDDIAPTVLDAAKLPVPEWCWARQKPIDGQSLMPSLAACDAAKLRTQYFELGSKTGLYHDGWFLAVRTAFGGSWKAAADGPRSNGRFTT